MKVINILFLNNKYILLILLIFILSFLSLWNPDNIRSKYIENFDNNNNDNDNECPKKYSNSLLNIARLDSKLNKNINDIETDYALNSIDIKTNRSGAAIYRGKFPKESNYNFSKKKTKPESIMNI